MNVMNAEEIKQKAAPILREEGAIRAVLFGSMARGEAKENSDIDIRDKGSLRSKSIYCSSYRASQD